MHGLVKDIPTQETSPLPAKAGGEVENILLVDDLPGNLHVYRTILEELGQNLITVSSGEEALKMVLQKEFAVILLDINMPALDGFETASLIRKRRKSSHTPIIFLTASTDEMSIIQGYASGAVDYLPTPIVPEILKAKVRVFIELSQMRRRAAMQAEEQVRREAAEKMAEKSEFLATASERLAHAQSQTELLQILVQLPIPYAADASLAWLRDEDAAVNKIEASCGQGIVHDNSMVLESQLPGIPYLKKEGEQVMAEGQPRLFSDPSLWPLHLSNKFPPLGSMYMLPLIVQGRPRGIFVLAYKYGKRIHKPDDQQSARDLAYHASVALENVTLMEKIREADRRKDEFLGMLAHELRNPLGPIYNAIQLQKMLPPDDRRMADLRDIIDRQAKHMGRLIDDLLDATRLANGKILLRKERCDLAKIVYQTAEDYRRILDINGLKLHVHGPNNAVWVNGDPTRIVQAIGNLLHNANKFTKQGNVTIRLKVDEPAAKAAITVIDTGIGIEPEMLRHVFDTFRQAEQGLDRSNGGLGLGLALVKGLVELHGGSVSAHSAGLNKGSTFAIRVPIEAVEEVSQSDIDAAPAPNGKKCRILVIEDNADAAKSVRMLLQLEGHEVVTASTAYAGLEAAQSFNPQVILCDIGLPGMDGYQIVKKIRQDERLSSVYVIALTGYGRAQDQRQALDAGFDLHMTKPINYKSLHQVLMSTAQG